MKLRRELTFLTASLALIASAASACGFCVEDRIATVYDHAAITHALKENHQVVFCSIKGLNKVHNEQVGLISASLSSIKGIDRTKIRISSENAIVAFTFDPSRTALDKILDKAREMLRPERLDVEVLRTMTKPAQLDRVNP